MNDGQVTGAPRPEGHRAESGPPVPVAVLDVGATAIRLVVAEIDSGGKVRVLEEASRGVLLGKDTFTGGRIGPATLEAALKALQGFLRIMEGYEAGTCRAVATSAIREATNRDSFLDRIRLRTGIEIEMIDGPEENRLTYMAVREDLGSHESMTRGDSVLVEIGGGSADISYLERGEPQRAGTYPLGSIRMSQRLASWHGTREGRAKVLRRYIHNVVGDIRREMPLTKVEHFIALGGDVRFAASRLPSRPAPGALRAVSVAREAFSGFCDEVMNYGFEELVERYSLQPAEAESLVPALLATQELLAATPASWVTVPEATLRDGLLLDMARGEEGRSAGEFRRQVLAGAGALGEKYDYDEAHARNVALLATRIFDDLQAEHGMDSRCRLLLEVAALLHDIGIYVGIRAHHKHSQYLISVSEIFGLSREDMSIVSNVARYHRRAHPGKSHLPYMLLDRQQRLEVSKMAAILRLANALDADHLQKVRDVRVVQDTDPWVLQVEGTGDVTIERLAMTARSDLFAEVFGRRISFQEAEVPR